MSRRSIALLCAGLVLLAGCGGKSAAPAPTATPRATALPTATPIPQQLGAYASFVDPILKSTVSRAQSLIATMQSPDYSTLANDCNNYAQSFVSAHSAVHASYTPPRAYPVYRDTEVGYKLLLAATDECGIAADSTSKSELATATSDVRNGIAQLQAAERTMSPWRKSAA